MRVPLALARRELTDASALVGELHDGPRVLEAVGVLANALADGELRVRDGAAQRGGAGAATHGPAPAGQSASASHMSRPGVAGSVSVTSAMPPTGGQGIASEGALASACHEKGVVV